MSLLGDAGLRRLARVNHANAVALADRLAAVKGVEVLNETFFNEFTIKIAGDAAEVVHRMAEQGVLGGGCCRTRDWTISFSPPRRKSTRTPIAWLARKPCKATCHADATKVRPDIGSAHLSGKNRPAFRA
jgi:hypothetical protein